MFVVSSCSRFDMTSNGPGKFTSQHLTQFSFQLGKLFKRHRRGLPSGVQAGIYDVFQMLRPFFQPSGNLTRAENLSRARRDIQELTVLLSSLATQQNSCVPSGNVPGAPGHQDVFRSCALTGIVPVTPGHQVVLSSGALAGGVLDATESQT